MVRTIFRKRLIATAIASSLVLAPVHQARSSAVAGALEPTQLINMVQLLLDTLQQLSLIHI